MSASQVSVKPLDLESSITKVAAVAAQHAERIDGKGEFPREFVDACRAEGLLGLISSKDHGGQGHGIRQAAMVVERVARECGSSAMVLTMHYCGAAVIEAHGPATVRRDLAAGNHLSTLAFSEAGSRSHFWAPTGTALTDGDSVVLDARKSWITSAHHATAYVWSSKPLAGAELSTLWLVPANAKGLRSEAAFDGLGLRGNDSCPVSAERVKLAADQRLGDDGAGFGIMMQTVLPIFCVLTSANSVGFCEAAVAKTSSHASKTKYEHLGSSLADLPTIRAYVARMRIDTDMARTLWLDTLDALENGRADVMLRVLEVKAGTAEVATRVLDTAMRVCGGLAYRKHVGVERAFRDGRASTVMAPTTDQLYDFIGKAVCGLPLF
ncbi:MAG TPA: acyl-CoA dehydrogenase family protein [Planctomycetota bacterium]|nr:acyl-CoA dehydrogenase family protein [Planctomycetota bacterium]